MALPVPLPHHNFSIPSRRHKRSLLIFGVISIIMLKLCEVYHRDNFGSESNAAGPDDYDHPDSYGSSFSNPFFHT